MSRASPEMQSLASLLVKVEKEAGSAPRNTPAAFVVCGKLKPYLASIMGIGGVRAILMRAIAIAHKDTDCLCAVRVKEDGFLEMERPLGLHSEANFSKVENGGEALVAELLGLLAAFIGDVLTLRMVHETWPELGVDNLYLRRGEKNEHEA